ncbi:MAG: ATP-binding protein [Desulfobacterales bacterium]
MATLHLICGLPSAGKTTYSASLADTTTGVHFALDHWLITAFGPYAIDVVGNDEHVRRVIACRKLIWSVAEELLPRNIDVILDDGFFLRAHRLHYAALAEKIDSDVTVHFVNTSADIIEARLKKRNQALPQDNFKIGPSLLLEYSRWFEAPSTDEGLRIVETNSDSDGNSTA